MKSDYYLNLCLEQAELSPLHHRHGCVVVKGGKVIGKGFNDYRHGYDGGALKTGHLPVKFPAFGKPKPKQKLNDNVVHGKKTGRKHDFKPFETTVGILAGGHHYGGNCLTMHSEMMAINSAFESSSTLFAITLSHIKPSTAPSRDSKRKRQRQLRRDILNDHAQRVCYDAAGPQVQQGTGPAKTAEKGYEAKYAHNQNNNANERSTPTRSQQPYIGEFNKLSTNVSNGGSSSGVKPGRSKYHESTKARNTADAMSYSNSLRDRMKHPKLRGADVYVARLGSTQKSTRNSEGGKTNIGSMGDCSSSTCIPIARRPVTGSLHDELLCKEPRLASSKASTHDHPTTLIDRGDILDSRPCYRCVLYMHSAGIKRVNWTNREGQWESAKVRDLFDRVSGANLCDAHDVNNSNIGGIFVTKHEILMLRRLSGQEDNRDN
ncbi:hypothetical protein F4781DRAFT_434146 [Annulohypoxylon bovei var. microspora]|nr:hypothetical protein F4781DRAFT_434146 [Annulohypoxylon bovei var. microspora]